MAALANQTNINKNLAFFLPFGSVPSTIGVLQASTITFNNGGGTVASGDIGFVTAVQNTTDGFISSLTVSLPGGVAPIATNRFVFGSEPGNTITGTSTLAAFSASTVNANALVNTSNLVPSSINGIAIPAYARNTIFSGTVALGVTGTTSVPLPFPFTSLSAQASALNASPVIVPIATVTNPSTLSITGDANGSASWLVVGSTA